MNQDDLVWERACEMFNTELPTDEQLAEAYQEMVDEAEDEYLNYHNEDGRN